MGDTEKEGAQRRRGAREEQWGGEHWSGEGDGNALGFGDTLRTRKAPPQLHPAGWERGGLAWDHGQQLPPEPQGLSPAFRGVSPLLIV